MVVIVQLTYIPERPLAILVHGLVARGIWEDGGKRVVSTRLGGGRGHEQTARLHEHLNGIDNHDGGLVCGWSLL